MMPMPEAHRSWSLSMSRQAKLQVRKREQEEGRSREVSQQIHNVLVSTTSHTVNGKGRWRHHPVAFHGDENKPLMEQSEKEVC